MPRVKKESIYYGDFEEQAVVAFLNATTSQEKERIYREYLQKPINKMIESIIKRYKLYRRGYEFNDLHVDTLSFLMTKFDKFKPEKGNKSYSYFGTICKNHLLHEMKVEHKRTLMYSDIDSVSLDDYSNKDLSYVIDEVDLNLVTFINDLNKVLKEELKTVILSDNEFKVGHAVVKVLEEYKTIFDNPNGVKESTKFNKNIILQCIRDMTGLSTKEIRVGMKRFKSIYNVFKNDYLD